MRQLVISVCLYIFVSTLQGSEVREAKECRPCSKTIFCPPLPADNCERLTRPCGCCEECATHMGEYCSADTPRCATGLMCMNEKGEALEEVPLEMKDYHGICQNVVVQPVVMENLDVEERQIGSKHYKHAV